MPNTHQDGVWGSDGCSSGLSRTRTPVRAAGRHETCSHCTPSCPVLVSTSPLKLLLSCSSVTSVLLKVNSQFFGNQQDSVQLATPTQKTLYSLGFKIPHAFSFSYLSDCSLSTSSVGSSSPRLLNIGVLLVQFLDLSLFCFSLVSHCIVRGSCIPSSPLL